ncbi:hypothetical protein DIPPA_23631 [Diplonema papillatum]|nr:hypothetical protein DIPPA_23631 [Diplonema papillatum]
MEVSDAEASQASEENEAQRPAADGEGHGGRDAPPEPASGDPHQPADDPSNPSPAARTGAGSPSPVGGESPHGGCPPAAAGLWEKIGPSPAHLEPARSAAATLSPGRQSEPPADARRGGVEREEPEAPARAGGSPGADESAAPARAGGGSEDRDSNEVEQDGPETPDATHKAVARSDAGGTHSHPETPPATRSSSGTPEELMSPSRADGNPEARNSNKVKPERPETTHEAVARSDAGGTHSHPETPPGARNSNGTPEELMSPSRAGGNPEARDRNKVQPEEPNTPSSADANTMRHPATHEAVARSDAGGTHSHPETPPGARNRNGTPEELMSPSRAGGNPEVKPEGSPRAGSGCARLGARAVGATAGEHAAIIEALARKNVNRAGEKIGDLPPGDPLAAPLRDLLATMLQLLSPHYRGGASPGKDTPPPNSSERLRRYRKTRESILGNLGQFSPPNLK